MKFEGEIELSDVSPEDAWLILTDPYIIRRAMPGCNFLVKIEGEDVDFQELEEKAETIDPDAPVYPDVDHEVLKERAVKEGERYGTEVTIGVGPISSTFRMIINIDRAEYPEVEASVRGESNNSSVEATNGMTIGESNGGSTIHWWAETNISGKIAQMGQRLLKPVSNRMVQNFFDKIEQQIQ